MLVSLHHQMYIFESAMHVSAVIWSQYLCVCVRVSYVFDMIN